MDNSLAMVILRSRYHVLRYHPSDWQEGRTVASTAAAAVGREYSSRTRHRNG